MRREVHNRFDAVGVLLYDPERDSLVLIEQFRAGAIDDLVSPWKLRNRRRFSRKRRIAGRGGLL